MTLAPRSLPLLLATAAALACAAPATASPPGTTVLADQPDGFDGRLSGAGAHSALGAGGDTVSADGRYVTFLSRSDGLSASDQDDVVNVYRKDRVTGAVVLVSVASDGTPSHADASDPHISDDGNRIAFRGDDPALDAAVTGTAANVYVRDVAAGTTTLASRRPGADGAAVAAHDPAISGDGGAVAFVTPAAIAPDENTASDVYLRRLGTAETVLVSRATGLNGTVGTQGSFAPSVNRDASQVAFASNSRLEAFDTNGRTDVYRRVVVPPSGFPSTDLISIRDGVLAAGNGDSLEPSISATGEAVAYETSASDLDAVTADTDGGVPDVMLFSGVDQVALTAGLYGDASGSSQHPHLAGEPGTLRVAFATVAAAADADTPAIRQIAVADVATKQVRTVSTGPDGSAGDGNSDAPSLSDDATVVAFATRAGDLGAGIGGDHADVVARAVAGTANELVSAPAGGPLPENLDSAGLRSRAGALTPDSRFAVFEAGHDGLGVSGRYGHVFQRELHTGRTVVVDRADGPAGAISGSAFDASQSADGRIVAFVTDTALDPADTNRGRDVYVRDMLAGTTRLVSRTPAGAAAAGESEGPRVSADGRHVAFTSDAPDLGDGDADGRYDVHVLDLATGAMTWVSRGAGPGDGRAFEPAISADGRRIAYTSEATNLDKADTDDYADVYVRDLASETSRLVSRRTDGTKGAELSETAAISADGRVVAFASFARLAGEDQDGVRDVYVHDRGSGTTVLASRASGAGGAKGDGPSYDPSLSADGRAVAFVTLAGNLGAAPGQLVVRRLDEATTTATGAPGDASALSADGACVLLATSAPAVTGSSPDHRRIVLRALRPACEVTTGAPTRPGGPGQGPGPGPGAGDAAPQLTALSLSRTRFAVAAARTARVARLRKGTVVRFSLDRTAMVRLTVQRRVHGRWVRAGVLRRGAVAGANRVRFSGRIGRRALRPGRHRIVARARDAAGRTSAPQRARFRIARVR